jgi:hypothetical protein
MMENIEHALLICLHHPLLSMLALVFGVGIFRAAREWERVARELDSPPSEQLDQQSKEMNDA